MAPDASSPQLLPVEHFVRLITNSWAQLNTGVPNATFLSLAINAGGYIFAGGDPLGGRVGVICSTDNGGTWQPVNNGLTTGNGINALIATVNG